MADDLAQDAQRHLRALLLLLEDDLRQGDGSQILLGAVVEYLDLGAALDHLGDFIERHVAALDRVVELAVRVSLDCLGLLAPFRRLASALGGRCLLLLVHLGSSKGASDAKRRGGIPPQVPVCVKEPRSRRFPSARFLVSPAFPLRE